MRSIESMTEAKTKTTKTATKTATEMPLRGFRCKKNVKLVSFLYELMRDHVPAGVVEGIVRHDELRQMFSSGEKQPVSNGYLVRYAQSLAERLLEK